MKTNNIISMTNRRPLDDLEVMAQFTNIPSQRIRREERRKADKVEKTVSTLRASAALFVSGGLVGFLVALCAFCL